MKLKQITIENYRTIKERKEITFDDSTSHITIIGTNGSGKSNWINAFRLAIDYKFRKNPINETDFHKDCDWTKDSITIEVELEIDENSNLKSEPILLGNSLYIKYVAKWNAEDEEFISTIFLNRTEEIQYDGSKKIKGLDDLISVIFIPPTFDEKYAEELLRNKLFNKKNSANNNKIKENFSSLNDALMENELIKDFSSKFNERVNQNFKSPNKFKSSIISNFNPDNIWKSLSFGHLLDSKMVPTHGSGYEKFIAINSKYETYQDENKDLIILLEEPENNMFLPYQRKIIEWIIGLRTENKLVIVTTHSPYIIKLTEGKSLVKVNGNNEPKFFQIKDKCAKIWHDLFSLVFYDYVLLVEGHSEEFLFNEILNDVDSYNFEEVNNVRHINLIIKSVGGIWFHETRDMLKALGIKVLVMTDNDFYNYKYEGVLRGLTMINENRKILNNYKDYMESIEKLEKNWIFLPIGTEDDFSQEEALDFEEALLREKLIDEKEKKKLKRSKLRNLHELYNDESKCLKNRIIELIKSGKSTYLFKWIEILKNEK